MLVHGVLFAFIVMMWPAVQASIPSNTFVISGRTEVKSVMELMPGILSQLSQEQLAKMAAMYGGKAAETAPEETAGGEEEIPSLVENFEEAAQK